jgi:hypothetical protein
MLATFGTLTVITTWLVLIWISRLPRVFLDFQYASYAAYAAFAATSGYYAVRLLDRRHPLRFVSDGWLWVFVAAVVLAGAHGLSQIGSIPPWLLTEGAEDLSVPWIYSRNVLLPSVLLPVLTMMIAAAIADRQRVETIVVPMTAFVSTFAILTIATVAVSPQAMTEMAQATERSAHLTDLGFHPNELGTLMAIGYALALGLQTSRRADAYGWIIRLTPIAAAVALVLTFSRGAYAAFAVVNAVFFLKTSTAQKAVLIAALLTAVLFAPAALMDRINFGMDTGDANVISAGRIENLWVPLLPDIAANLLLGQGLQSIMWTDAQLQQLIFAVTLAHNAYLDLLLDFGLVGAAAVLGWYIHVWRRFVIQSVQDPDDQYRALFYGGHLAMISMAVCGLTNDRFTPTASNCLIWIGAGVAIGRQMFLRRAAQPANARHVRLPSNTLLVARR